MWVSKEKLKKMEKRILQLEDDSETIKTEMEYLKESMVMKICTNSLMKEEYNFRVLRLICEKLNIEPPDSEYQFARCQAPPDNNR